MHQTHESPGETDGFDRIPDSLVLLIFNKLSDAKTLCRCRTVTKRFNSLVPQSENLLVRVDSVISTENQGWLLKSLINPILHALQNLISPKKPSHRNRNSPTDILRGFEKIRNLEIELPSGDLRLDDGVILKWKAEFGRSLKRCVIVAVRKIVCNGDCIGEDDGFDGGMGGLKMRVLWTISALIAASARHYMLNDVISERREMESLTVRDVDGKGTVVMGTEGLREFREKAHFSVVEGVDRTILPDVRMSMRHVERLDLPGGVRMIGATLVVVNEMEGSGGRDEEEEKQKDGFALGAFGGVLKYAVEALVKMQGYHVEMNSF